jgi:hypothetical protein
MSAIFKGYAGVVVHAEEPYFDAENGSLWVDVTYQGGRANIFGVMADLQAQDVSYRVSQDGPVFTLTARFPTIVNTDTPADRYEITTESQDKSIFEHPLALAAADEWDFTIQEGESSWRQSIEDALEAEGTGLFSGKNDTTEGKVIRHLRGGVTGWQIDFLVLRRFRQVALQYANAAGKIGLDDGQFIYSTAQLSLPAGVAFSLPSTPAAPSDDYAWGWRKRGQRVEIVGNFAEQTVELVFAPWSTFLYTNASGNLAW